MQRSPLAPSAWDAPDGPSTKVLCSDSGWLQSEGWHLLMNPWLLLLLLAEPELLQQLVEVALWFLCRCVILTAVLVGHWTC